MSVTLTELLRIGFREWRVSFTSTLTDVFFQIFHEGRRVGSTRELEFVISVDDDNIPLIEVTDDVTTKPTQISFSGRVILNWYTTGADRYRVDEFVDSSFEQVATLFDQGQGYFEFQSRFLEDVTSHKFRVVPIDAVGNEGQEVELDVLMVRPPDVPLWKADYNAGTNEVTIDIE